MLIPFQGKWLSTPRCRKEPPQLHRPSRFRSSETELGMSCATIPIMRPDSCWGTWEPPRTPCSLMKKHSAITIVNAG